MDTKPQNTLTEIQYWWVFSVSLLAPFASIWTESGWVLRGTIVRHNQALIYWLDNPGLWIIAGLEFFFTLCSLILLRRWLGAFVGRWGIAFCFYVLWTGVAFVIMPAPCKS